MISPSKNCCFILVSFLCFAKTFEIVRQISNVQFGNFVKTDGIVFNSSASLLTRTTTSSETGCLLKCLKNSQCYTINVIESNKVLQCELFKACEGCDGVLVEQKNSYLMKLKPPPLTCLSNPCLNGGTCYVSLVTGQHACNCSISFTGRYCQIGCMSFDFESGNISEWSLTGTAFNNQPTYGDNPKSRARESSNHKGHWWIGGYENRPTPSHSAGAVQGDAPIGTMTSPAFTIRGNAIRFLIGGGSDVNLVRLELLIDGNVVAKEASSRNYETMGLKSIDVTAYKGKLARIRIVDHGTVGWGHINVDDIHEDCRNS